MKARALRKVAARLNIFLADLLAPLGRSERQQWGSQYVQGLLGDSERKNVTGVASRFPDGNSQAIQQFLHSSPWQNAPVRLAMTRKALGELDPVQVCIVDDTGFPKKGKHSVGVARQYSGTLGKVDNCQVAVSLHWATAQASFPMDWSLYLPVEWINDLKRRRKAGIPDEVVFRHKWELALDMLDRALDNRVSLGVIVADAAYGSITAFREALDARQLSYAVGIEGTLVFWPRLTHRQSVSGSGKGRPPKPRYPVDEPPQSAVTIANNLPDEAWHEITYWKGTKGPHNARFAALRVQPAHHHQKNEPELPMVWLLIQKTDDPKTPYKFFLSNLNENTPLVKLAIITKMRWRIEMDYQILKGEIGLDHYEGRSWNGWHHHVTLCTMAYLFLLIELSQGSFSPETHDP